MRAREAVVAAVAISFATVLAGCSLAGDGFELGSSVTNPASLTIASGEVSLPAVQGTGAAPGAQAAASPQERTRSIDGFGIAVEAIEAHHAGQGWLPIAAAPGFVRLSEAESANEFVPLQELPHGRYTQIRISVLYALVQLDDNVYASAAVPGGILKLVRPFEIVRGYNTELKLVFDLGKSVVTVDRTGRYTLKPVMRLESSLIPE